MANPEKVAFCHECHEQLTTANHANLTEIERKFLSSEQAAAAAGLDMKFGPGQCSKCGKDTEVICY